jgi:hypothetical protein
VQERRGSSHALPVAGADSARVCRTNARGCRYGGGRAGLSDTMAGTLWVADALFAFASAGARAFHLHWGHGGLPFEGGAPNVGVQTNFDYNTVRGGGARGLTAAVLSSMLGVGAACRNCH